MDYTLHGILLARILEWVAVTFSRGTFLTQWLNPGLPHCRQILYHLSHQVYQAIEKEWNNATCSNTDGPRDYAKPSKSERERQIPYDISYVWNLKYDINEHSYKINKLTDIKNRLVVANKVFACMHINIYVYTYAYMFLLIYLLVFSVFHKSNVLHKSSCFICFAWLMYSIWIELTWCILGIS